MNVGHDYVGHEQPYDYGLNPYSPVFHALNVVYLPTSNNLPWRSRDADELQPSAVSWLQKPGRYRAVTCVCACSHRKFFDVHLMVCNYNQKY